jgi:hypothetical protein
VKASGLRDARNTTATTSLILIARTTKTPGQAKQIFEAGGGHHGRKSVAA